MNDNKPQQPKPERSIPVRLLRLREKMPLPIGGVTDVLIGDEKQENKVRYVIEYLPSLRHHRVAYYQASAKVPTSVIMISEGAAASWEPVAL